MTVAIFLTLTACFAAAYFDVRARRIPNWLTGATALAALAVHASSGLAALGVSASVMFVLTLVGALLYSRGGIGGGDIKLAIATCGMLSYPLCLLFLFYTAIGGGILAILYMIFRADARPAFARVALVAGGAGSVTSTRATLPYAIAFAFGSVAVALSQTLLPALRI
jgi:prepilin peptidase CpaA